MANRKETQKVFTFHDNQKDDKITITIPEVVDPSFGMYVWPCAPILAQYIWFNRHIVIKKTVLELGAGTALPGILSAKLGAKVILSDAAHLPECQENCRNSCLANGVTDVEVIGLSWGQIDEKLLNMKQIDIILGSDCFYEPKDFEDIIVTASFLLKRNPNGEFWTTYQERSVNRSIEHLLLKWDLQCQQIDLLAFGIDGDAVAGSHEVGDNVQMLVIKHRPEVT